MIKISVSDTNNYKARDLTAYGTETISEKPTNIQACVRWSNIAPR